MGTSLYENMQTIENCLFEDQPSQTLCYFSKQPWFECYPFSLLKSQKDTKQSPVHHPEGNVWNHTLLVVDEAAKGNDYDRESGKFEFSGKEYIPDFIIPKLNLCIEVKLLREGKRSRIIDEINADVTAYSTHYERLMFVVYDLGVIRDEGKFRRDIENAGNSIKVVIVKH